MPWELPDAKLSNASYHSGVMFLIYSSWRKHPIKRVSVIVPNYNYAEYLAERIKSLSDHNYPIYGIIILDDASTDDSVPVINKIISTLDIDCQLIENKSNSGNTFAQWLKGVEISQGDYVWIAEADDLSVPGFLDEVLQPFRDPSVVMSYCQSKQWIRNVKSFVMIIWIISLMFHQKNGQNVTLKMVLMKFAPALRLRILFRMSVQLCLNAIPCFMF